MNNFRTIDRQTGFLLPPSVDEWLPEKHLARFVVEVIDGMDLRAMSGSYRGSGSASYHPRMLLGILVYGYATGIFSSRKLERATYDSVAFRFIAANDHPDHDTIATFRRRFLTQIEGLFVQVLVLAREIGVLKLGTVGLDGTKIHANASRHSALSYEHAGNIETQLKAEVADLMAKAEAADQADIPDGFSIPEELERREERLRKLAEARAKIEARAKERHAREQAEHEAKLAAARGQDRGDGQEARRQAAAASGRGAAAKRSDQSHRRRLAHHACGGRRLRAVLQRAGRRGGGKLAGGRGRCGSGAKRQAAARADAGQDRGLARSPGRTRNAAGGHGLFQRGECRGMRKGGDRTADRHGASTASSAAGRTLRTGAARARESDAGRGHGASAADAERPGSLRPAQTNSGTGVRHHQSGARIPSILAPRARQGARRVEPRDHGLEYEEDVRPQPRLTRPCAAWRRESRRLPSIGEITTRSGRHQTSGGSWQRQNHPRRSATKPQSDGLLGPSDAKKQHVHGIIYRGSNDYCGRGLHDLAVYSRSHVCGFKGSRC